MDGLLVLKKTEILLIWAIDTEIGDMLCLEELDGKDLIFKLKLKGNGS